MKRIPALIVFLALCLSLVSPSIAGETDGVVVVPETPSCSAAAAIVMDCDTGEVYYAKNEDTARPVASMTKVMTAYMVFEAITRGDLSLDSTAVISSRAAAISKDTRYSGMERFQAGQRIPADTLLRLMLVASGNASALALAELTGGTEQALVQAMNAKTAPWGIDAHFADCSGYEDEGNAVTAYAMAYITRRAIIEHPEILGYTALKSVEFQGRIYQTTDVLLRDGGVEGLDGMKTGHTHGAGYCFTGTAERNGRRVIAVVMGTDTAALRMSEAQALLEYGFARQAIAPTYSFKGRMSIQHIEMYQDSCIPVVCTVACLAPQAELLIPCGWYLDGELLAGFQNPAFRISGTDAPRKSQITMRADKLAVGEHTLEFRCNSLGLGGTDTMSFTTTIIILCESEALG